MRVENTKLDRENVCNPFFTAEQMILIIVSQAQLEKQVKDLNVRVVDLETKSYTATPGPNATIRQLQARIGELTAQLNLPVNDRRHSVTPRSPDKAVRDIQLQLQESERHRLKLEQDRKASEGQIQNLRKVLVQQTSESELVRANRRLELQAAEAKQTTLTLEREVERLRSRINRPASSVISDTPSGSGGSSVGSPRKLKPS
ncbi:hypothetical protein JVU11DRAFT_8438 [Chiua virens]|nr:hypothetical protein JVU11DRAFT_8438 [Chiua virens]